MQDAQQQKVAKQLQVCKRCVYDDDDEVPMYTHTCYIRYACDDDDDAYVPAVMKNNETYVMTPMCRLP